MNDLNTDISLRYSVCWEELGEQCYCAAHGLEWLTEALRILQADSKCC